MGTMRNNHNYVQRRDALRRKARANGSPCHLCGKPINWEASWKAADSFTADHIDPVATGGKMLGPLLPAHRGCNASRGVKPLDEYLAEKRESRPAPTRRTTTWS